MSYNTELQQPGQFLWWYTVCSSSGAELVVSSVDLYCPGPQYPHCSYICHRSHHSLLSPGAVKRTQTSVTDILTVAPYRLPNYNYNIKCTELEKRINSFDFLSATSTWCSNIPIIENWTFLCKLSEIKRILPPTISSTQRIGKKGDCWVIKS